jgi:hypothetical protein
MPALVARFATGHAAAKTGARFRESHSRSTRHRHCRSNHSTSDNPLWVGLGGSCAGGRLPPLRVDRRRNGRRQDRRLR